jgi:hypothetical protein
MLKSELLQYGVTIAKRYPGIPQIIDEHMFDISHTEKQKIYTFTIVRRGDDIDDRVLP